MNDNGELNHHDVMQSTNVKLLRQYPGSDNNKNTQEEEVYVKIMEMSKQSLMPIPNEDSVQTQMDMNTLICKTITSTTNTVLTTSTTPIMTTTLITPSKEPIMKTYTRTRSSSCHRNSNTTNRKSGAIHKESKKFKLDSSLKGKLIINANKSTIDSSPYKETNVSINVPISNKYALLENPEMEIEVVEQQSLKGTETQNISPRKNTNSQQRTQDRKVKIPPITLKMATIPEDFFSFNRTLQRKLSSPLKIAYSLDGVKYHTSTAADYDSLYKYFQERKLPFYSHEINKQKTIQVVLKRLPVSVTPKMVEEELTLLGYKIIHVRQMTKLSKTNETNIRHPLAAWVVTLPLDEHSATIYNLKDLNNHIVTIEHYRNTPHLIQCHRCQSVGHTATHCHLPIRCVKCSGPHNFAECDKKGETFTPMCANCNGQHTATYGQCPYLNQQKQLIEKRQASKLVSLNTNNSTQVVPTKEDFPKMPTPKGTIPNFTPQTSQSSTTTSSNSSIGDLLLEIKNLFSCVNIPHIIMVLKSIAGKFRTAPDTLTKITALIDGASSLIDAFTSSNGSH